MTHPPAAPSPDHILAMGLAFWQSKALLSAVELGLFTALADGPLTAEQLRRRLDLHPRAMPDFADTLLALGLLQREGSGPDAAYANTAATQAFLDRRDPGYIGGWLCGRERYRISGGLALAGHRHGSICRRAHGAPFATWALLAPGQLRWTEGEHELTGFPSSAHLGRLFCRHCGSPLAAVNDSGVAEVVLASVDGDPGVRPSAHIFIGSKACWDTIHDGLPRHEAWPPDIVA